MGTAAPIQVVTVDEDSLVREGLAAVINSAPEMRVVGEAATGAAAIELCRRYRPDVVTVDLSMDVDVVSALVAEFPGVRIVAVTRACGDVQVLRALERGVRGLVLRGMQHRELLDSIRMVHAGRKAIPSRVATMLAEHMGDEALTPRELDVLRLVADGNRNKQVAAALNIADETVRMHMKNILGKLRANDRTHAVTIALTRGILRLEGNLGRVQ